MKHRLGQALAAVVHLLGLSQGGLGGSFARAWEAFHLPLAEELHHRLTLFPREAPSVVPAKLGETQDSWPRLSWPGTTWVRDDS